MDRMLHDQVTNEVSPLTASEEQELHRLARFYWREAGKCAKVEAYFPSAVMLAAWAEAVLLIFNRVLLQIGWADLVGCIVTRKRPAMFRGRHFEDVIILLCVRWYLRYSLTYRDLEEILAERNLAVDHVTIWHWVQRYAPVLNQRIRREMRNPNRSWRVDETYVKVAGKWAYLYRAVDSAGETIEFMLSPKRDLMAATLFLRLALSQGTEA